MNRIIKKILLTILLAVSAVSLTACNTEKTEDYYAFGTYIEVKISGTGASKILKSYFQLFGDLTNDFDGEVVGGSLYKINHAAADEVVTVSAEAYELLTLSKEMYEVTDGAFNIATYGLSELWKFTSATYNTFVTYNPPSADAIAEVLPYCNLDNLVLLGNNTVKKTDGALKVGFGAVAKGYAGDLALKQLGKKNKGLLNVGGTIFTVGEVKKVIAITNPRDSSFSYFGTLTVSGGAVVCTSGDYERYYMVDNTRYHHILGKNGYPVDNGVAGVTILSLNNAASGAVCDILSTAVFAMIGNADYEALLTAKGVGAIIIYNDNTYKTVGIPDGVFELTDLGYRNV